MADVSDKIPLTLGAYFSNNTFTVNAFAPSTTITPQIIQDTTQPFTNTTNWRLLSGIYQASGGENYLSFGNFRVQNQIVETRVPHNNTPAACNFTVSNYSYFFVDDVSLYETYSPPLLKDTSICYGEEISLGTDEVISSLTYTWQPSEGLSCINCSNPTAKITKNITYVLTTQFCDALSTDSVRLAVKFCPNKDIPNVFTPNGDGINDVWQAIIPSGSTNINCNVYNRWGNVVYSLIAQPPVTNAIWDGYTPSGIPCSEGVYFYSLTYDDSDGNSQQLKGCISLFK